MSKPLNFPEARAHLIRLATQRGVQLEVYAQRGQSTSIKAFGGQVSEFKLASRQGLGLRALVNGSWGYAYTENLTPAALERALTSAIENAELTEPAAHAALHAWTEPPALDLHGEGLSGVSVERKVQTALQLERTARDADPRVVSVPHSMYNDGESHVAVASTAGLDREYRELHAMQFVAPLLHEDGQNKSKSSFQFTREFEELDPTRTALDATHKSAALLGAKPAPSGPYPTVIDGRCMAKFLGVFAGMFSAKQVQEGKSPLAGRLGQALAAAHVTLIDDATLPRGMESRPFDAEGCPSAPLTLIDGGTLSAYLHNAHTAAADGVASTGHAARSGYRGTVGVGPTNLYLQAGTETHEALLAQIGTGLLLTDIQGVHAGASPVTGDFSLQAEGFWVDGGQVSHPLDVFTVAGNILELLADIEAVGSDLQWTPSGTGAPSVRVKTLSLGGQ